MITSTRKTILRANALYLGIASVAAAPYAAIGLCRSARPCVHHRGAAVNAQPVRYAHLTVAAVMTLLGVSNLVFWPLFTATGMTTAGVLLTSGHLGFALAQLLAASGPRARAAV
jgi:hypothetical protein